MKRRSVLSGMAAGAAISTLDWLRFFRSAGIPGGQLDLGIAKAHAQVADDPAFLIYWNQEGGWDGYSMFNAVDTANDATRVIPAGTLRPTPGWTAHRYRPKNYGATGVLRPSQHGNITYGHLAAEASTNGLLDELAVVSSHYGSTFHSGGRWDYHYGRYSHNLGGTRAADERSVLQAFCEQKGASFLLPHISWHRWLSDGELSPPNYPEGTGYYERLGPSYAHTIYGRTPAEMRNRLTSLGALTSNARNGRVRQFVENLHNNFLADRNSESVRAFRSAVEIHKSLTGGGGAQVLNPAAFFTDPELRAHFGVTSADEATTATSVNGNPARSKESPNTNAQALMAYELMTKGLSCGFFIESREIRGFDTHRDRRSVMSNAGQTDQKNMMGADLWKPLRALVTKLKETPYQTSGKSFWDYTTIVLCSEMGRIIHGDVEDILANPVTNDEMKYQEILDQDVCQHWKVHSTAFLGGQVRKNVQFGRVGSDTLDAIPILPDGTLDPAFDPVSGNLKPGATKSAQSFVTNAGHVWATALSLCGLTPGNLRDKNGVKVGRNTEPPLSFIKAP